MSPHCDKCPACMHFRPAAAAYAAACVKHCPAMTPTGCSAFEAKTFCLPAEPPGAPPADLRGVATAWLRANGYDGLCNLAMDYDGCGCLLDDLMPCDAPHPRDCRPGHKGPSPDGADFAVYLTREAAEAAESENHE